MISKECQRGDIGFDNDRPQYWVVVGASQMRMVIKRCLRTARVSGSVFGQNCPVAAPPQAAPKAKIKAQDPSNSPSTQSPLLHFFPRNNGLQGSLKPTTKEYLWGISIE